MTPDHLRKALAAESDRVEWKQSAHNADPILRAACALANDLGTLLPCGSPNGLNPSPPGTYRPR